MASGGDRAGLLRVLYVTIFLTATGLGTASFMLPVYATSLGANYVDLGLMGAFRNVVYTIMTLTVGYLLDRFERIRIYVGFMIVGVAVVALFGLMTQVALLIAWSSLLGLVSAAFWVTASTLTANISPPERLSQSMGRYNLSWILGFVVGPTAGGYISGAYGYQILFLCLAAVILASIFVILWKIRPAITLRNKSESSGFSLAPLRRQGLAYLTLIPFTCILGIYMAIMPGYLKLVGLAPALVGLLLTMTNGVRGVGFFNAERFIKWGTRRSVSLASLLLFGGMLILSYASSTLEYALPLVLYGAAAGIMTPFMLDYIAKRCNKESLGAAMGLHEGVYGVGMCLGPMVGGTIAELWGPPLLYRLLAVLALTMLPLAYMLSRNGEQDTGAA
ncbi:MAG: MFS transporter [Candidatus Bathyarchaeota archaeon]|nr:MFS transporter [Candidatus Bathyarchaeota archaeon]